MSQKYLVSIWLGLVLAFFGVIACTQDGDGPIPIATDDTVYSGEGFFRIAELDSGKLIHLTKDTLYLHLDSIWAFSNCALKQIKLDTLTNDVDSAFEFYPSIIYQTSNDDCAAPYLHPDTTIRILLGRSILMGLGVLRVYNDEDSLMDTILIRRGDFSLDTFEIYVDTLFDSIPKLPRRTKGSPSIIKVLDSLTPQIFHWRTMESNCTHRVDKCTKTVPDTIYPTYWSLGDTALVPIRLACADTDEVYCIRSRWEDDSTALGEVQERPDTIWHTSTYYIETIPKCGAMNRFMPGSVITGRSTKIVRELYTPWPTETFCGPSTKEDLFVYDLGRNYMVPDTVDVDSLFETWKSAPVGATKAPTKTTTK